MAAEDKSEAAAAGGGGGKEAEVVVKESMGSFGRWQLKVVLLMSLTKFPVAWSLLGLVFMGAPPASFACASCPACPDPCTDPFGSPCSRWSYNRTDFDETIVTEWDLVCEKSQLVNVAQMTFMIGIMIGNILFSIASDRLGRKGPLVVSGLLQVFAGVAVAFVPWYAAFVLLRVVQAIAVGGTMTVSFVLCMEVLDGKWRTIMSTLSLVPFNIGTITMSIIAYYTRNWRHFQLATTLPLILIIFYWWLVPESPRWLLAVGKNKEALKVLKQAAKTNKRPPPDNILEKVEDDQSGRRAGLVDLLRTPNMRAKTLVLWFNWAVVGFNFFGLEQYLSQTGGNIFLNVIFSGACIIPGILMCIYTLDKLGRRMTLFGGQSISATCCLLILCLPHNAAGEAVGWTRVGLAVVGVSGTAVAFTTLYLYSSELFPTVVRNTGLGSGSMVARIGSMVAPFVASLEQASYMLPPLLFGTTSVCAAGLCLLLPETLNTKLPITLEDGEAFKGVKKGVEKEEKLGKDNKGFSKDA